MLENAPFRLKGGVNISWDNRTGSVTKAKLAIRWQTVRGIADDAALVDSRQ